jgi:hypothetical protein
MIQNINRQLNNDKNLRMRILNIFIIIIVSVNPLWSQSINYQEIFGDDWKKAESFEKANRKWMEPLLIKNNISYQLAIAVIFPELVRYSALREKMEVALLKTLYINLGEDYADFSIGQFQMKPSFAEMIRSGSAAVMSRKSGIKFKTSSDYDNITDYRKSIVTDLEDPATQFTYLIAFIKICEKNYQMTGMNEIEKVKFLATAYNYGIDKSSEQITNMIDKKFFNTKLFKTTNYSYAGVSLFWYEQYMAGRLTKPKALGKMLTTTLKNT